MARKKPPMTPHSSPPPVPLPSPAAPMGPVLAANLIRLGYVETTVRATEVARLVTESGRPMSRQRMAALLNSVKIQRGTIEAIARGLGVEPEELLREGPGKGGN